MFETVRAELKSILVAADEEGEDFALSESRLTGEEVLPLMPVSLWSDSDIS
ncbi:hypothetical protein A2U01_0105502, partial [Trifolium medium]|nr:hypothetical protein [Trifolium medium]